MFRHQTSTLIDYITLECPICDKIHKVEMRKRNATAKLRGHSFEYIETYYRCTNHNVDFVTGKLMDENLAIAKEKYKNLYG